MRKSFLLLIILFVFISSFMQHNNKQNSNEKKVVFFDDFSGSKLDRQKWNVIVNTGDDIVNNEQQAYVDSDSTIQIVHGTQAEGATNGALMLKPMYVNNYTCSNGRKFNFLSGRINTKNKFECNSGTISARIKMTAASGLWPAFWLLGNGDWPATGEIDIMEYVGEKDWVSAALHGPGYSGETPFVNKFFFHKNMNATDWHVYAVNWEKDQLTFFVDNEVYYKITKSMVEHYGKWALDNEKYIILNFAVGGVYPVKLNGIKSPFFGMTDESIQAIKNNKAKMLVDWVKAVN